MKKKCCLIISVIFVLLFSTSIAFSHSGGTDANGGHHDYNNVSGLGDYHYHHGYGPHLHTDGICPYANDSSVDTYTYSEIDSEESYTMTWDKLQDYVMQSVNDDPESYNMVRIEDYQDLQRKYEQLEDHTISIEESVKDVIMGVSFTAIAGALACYFTYKKCNK